MDVFHRRDRTFCLFLPPRTGLVSTGSHRLHECAIVTEEKNVSQNRLLHAYVSTHVQHAPVLNTCPEARQIPCSLLFRSLLGIEHTSAAVRFTD